MKIEDCTKRIDRYIRSDDTHPRFVNIHNSEDMRNIIQHFSVGSNIFKNVSDFSKHDENPSIDSLFNYLNNAKGVVFVSGFTSHYSMLGERRLREFFDKFWGYSNSDCKIIVFCYQCDKYLGYSEAKRYEQFIYDIDGEKQRNPELIFIAKELPQLSGIQAIDGIEKISTYIENHNQEKIYVRTVKEKDSFQSSLFHITEYRNAYKMLCEIDESTQRLEESYGSDKQWIDALNELSKYKSWMEYISNLFGSYTNLELIASSWKLFDEKKKWLYFIALKLFKSKNSWCINKAIDYAHSCDMLIRGVYRSILSLDWNAREFWDCYEERISLIRSFGKSDVEENDYCAIVKSKGKYALYYLSCASKMEINLIFELLDIYALEFEKSEIVNILKHIYLDLYQYLQPYRFNNPILDSYFQDYKYQKVVNKIFSEFVSIVEEQAEKREFNLWLPSRSEKIESIEKKNTALYFIDAMGVEYLSFIMEKCRQRRMTAYATICHCELPSITCFNKEFIDVFEAGGATFIPDRNGIKALDDIKHHGQEEFDFQSNQLPTYLARELEIIDTVLEKINTKLVKGEFSRAVLIADHGASRLSVISRKENKWEMASNGQHSGRCCPKNEIDEQPACSTEDNNFWVLANYDRFKGGRPGNIEVHGGATLEEVVVPMIEITLLSEDIEIIIITPEIEFSTMKKNAVIKMFSKTKLSNVTVKMSDGESIYEAETNDGRTFIVKMPYLRKAGDYYVDVYSNNNKVQSGLKFIASKEGFKENKLL